MTTSIHLLTYSHDHTPPAPSPPPQALPPYEKVVVGTTKFGMRSTQVSPEFEAITHSWSQQLLAGVAPCSPSYFHFVSHRGSPVLLGVRVGQMHTEHFAAKFLQQYAPGETPAGGGGMLGCCCSIFCWVVCYKETV
jgi:hypothetical protein